jgi:hypothetical protein
MNQNTYFNIFIVLVILLIIKYISPDPDSVLYVLKKYLNFLIFKINNTISIIFNTNEKFVPIKTFSGIKKFNDTTPKFVSYYENFFIQKMISKNPSLNINILKNLYKVIDNMVTLDIDDYFMTVSDSNPTSFTNDELNKISNILLNKLNLAELKFTNLSIKEPVVYYSNPGGKEISPFLFTVNCDHNIGPLTIYIESDIRNDIITDKSILVIKKIRINIDDTKLNNITTNESYINYDNNTNFIYDNDFINTFSSNDFNFINTFSSNDFNSIDNNDNNNSIDNNDNNDSIDNNDNNDNNDNRVPKFSHLVLAPALFLISVFFFQS